MPLTSVAQTINVDIRTIPDEDLTSHDASPGSIEQTLAEAAALDDAEDAARRPTGSGSRVGSPTRAQRRRQLAAARQRLAAATARLEEAATAREEAFRARCEQVNAARAATGKPPTRADATTNLTHPDRRLLIGRPIR